MITAQQLRESQLDQLYDWIDGLPLSKPKKNISRDFADGILMAQVVNHFYPKIVQLHNYPAGNSYKMRLSNWQTLRNKVLNKLGINLTQDDCSKLANATPMAIEATLYQVKKIVDDAILLYQNQTSPQQLIPDNSSGKRVQQFQGGSSKNMPTANPHHNVTKVQELKQILSLIKEKMNIVEKSLERKDGQIRQLEQILRQAGQ